jgi:hypothetical protein
MLQTETLMHISWVLASSIIRVIALMMVAVSTSEALVYYGTA